MPAGTSWPRYLRMLSASILAMFAGAQVVHQYYIPDLVRDITDSFSLVAYLFSRIVPELALKTSGDTQLNVISCYGNRDTQFQCLRVSCCVICQSIPEIPPKPGELQTELRGYKIREEALAASMQQLTAEQRVD